ncbi:MAG: cell surface protein [Pseudomonadota bacterium]|nr:cell surface protein [Pseudomonadota bacterium]
MTPLVVLLLACTSTADKATDDTGAPTPADTATDTASDTGRETGDTGTGDTAADLPDPFVDRVVSYSPGAAAGFGQDRLPDIVYGSPAAPGDGGGSVDVLTLGQEGEIVIAFDDIALVDGEGPDLLVFENPFSGWYETGYVAASEDGETWFEWPCDPTDAAGLYPGCAGVAIVYANATNGVDATDPAAAGGDAFDLADVGLARARYVRVRDSGANGYAGTSGGFDLDAMAVVHGEAVAE